MLGICCSTHSLAGNKKRKTWEKPDYFYKFKCADSSECSEGKKVICTFTIPEILCSKRWILCDRSVLSFLNNFWIQSLWQAGSHSHTSVDNLRFTLVLSSFGLNRLGRSKQSYEHHQACHCAELLDVGGLFNRRNTSPLSDWQVVELTLCLWMKLKVKIL